MKSIATTDACSLYIFVYSFLYSTNSRDAHIWLEGHGYPLSLDDRSLAIYVGCQTSSEILHNYTLSSCNTCFGCKIVEYKTVILLINYLLLFWFWFFVFVFLLFAF